MAKRSQVLGALEGLGTGFSKMGAQIMERERYDTQKALEEEEADRKRKLFPSELDAAQAGAGLAKTQASEALASAEKRKTADDANQAMMAENAAAGWQVDPDDQPNVGTWKSELNTLNRFRAKEGKPALSVGEYVTGKKQEKTDRAFAQNEEGRKTKDAETRRMAAESGRYQPIVLEGGGIGRFNAKQGTVEDTGAKAPAKLANGKTAQEKHDEGVFKAKDKLRDAYEKTGTANAIIMLNDIATKIGGVDGTGDVAGYGKTGLLPAPMLGQEGKDIRTSLAGLRNIVLKDRSGAAVSNQEFERLKEEIGGGLFSDDKDLRSKLNRMGEIVAQHAQNIDATFQGDPDVPQQAFDQYRKAGGTTGASLNLKSKPAAQSSKFKILSVED